MISHYPLIPHIFNLPTTHLPLDTLPSTTHASPQPPTPDHRSRIQQQSHNNRPPPPLLHHDLRLRIRRSPRRTIPPFLL